MIGIVVVSHSRALARAAVALAEEMVPPERRPPVAIAAGLDEDTFGTDAEAISSAIEGLDADGVLVLLDLGSAILSAEMALEFLDPEDAAGVRLSPAPLVEGLIAAFVTASTGADLDAVAADADAGLRAKREQLGVEEEASDEPAQAGATADDHQDADAPASGDQDAGSPDARRDAPLTWTTTLTTPHGLHARPAATLVQAVQGLDATVQLSDLTNGKGPVPAGNMLLLTTLGSRQGDELAAEITGPDAARARDALQAWADGGFGDA